jgi:hypothetical protein
VFGTSPAELVVIGIILVVFIGGVVSVLILGRKL